MRLLNLLKLFLPWIMYGFISSFSKSFAIGFALILALCPYKQLKKGFWMEWTTLMAFLSNFIFAVIFKSKWFETYESFLFISLFASISWLSLFLKRPFTMQYAKEKVEERYWNSPLFHRINHWMTLSFALLFSLMEILQGVLFYYPNLFSLTLVGATLLPLKLLFIQKFPDWYKKRVLSRSKEKNHENYSY